MTVVIALFTADPRTHDNPVLRGALDAADQVRRRRSPSAGRAAEGDVPDVESASLPETADIAAGFLAKTLYLDWRAGARHFLDLLVDGDVRRRLDYPEPIVDLDEGLAGFRRARGG
jgi:FAD binding domain of DNA photolyase